MVKIPADNECIKKSYIGVQSFFESAPTLFEGAERISQCSIHPFKEHKYIYLRNQRDLREKKPRKLFMRASEHDQRNLRKSARSKYLREKIRRKHTGKG